MTDFGDLKTDEGTAIEEAVRLLAATEPLPFIAVGRGTPQGDGTTRPVYPLSATVDVGLFLVPGVEAETDVGGKNLCWLPAGEPLDGTGAFQTFPNGQIGPYHVAPGADGRRLPLPWSKPDLSLAHLEILDGKPTLLFLLPFLAVGGAERLLFDLLAGLGDRYRCLVVTLEPHQQHLGCTVHRCAEHTPWIFTLGDWLPRPAHLSALRHLIRRFDVRALMSWNGTVLFYDQAQALRRSFPELRILHQLYHFEGGWTARTSPAVIRAVDCHVAVNHPIERSLAHGLRVPKERIAVIHHGVPLPDRSDQSDEVDSGARLRRRWGIPEDVVVAGTFIRLHAQKRPLDLLRLARRFRDDELWIVLMGDGPLSGKVAEELEAAPISNLVRIPMQNDPLPFYAMVDLCLMTSDYEGLPVFLLDGAARGRPGVAPSVGDIPLLFETGGGRCSARPGDLDALEMDLRHLLDPENRNRAGAAARRRVEERFGLETYVAAYEDILFPDHTERPS